MYTFLTTIIDRQLLWIHGLNDYGGRTCESIDIWLSAGIFNENWAYEQVFELLWLTYRRTEGLMDGISILYSSLQQPCSYPRYLLFTKIYKGSYFIYHQIR
jgi:hypothetical protein